MITTFKSEHIPAMRQLFQELGISRPASDSFWQWRYEDCPAPPVAWLSLKGGRCVALLGAFGSQWWVGGERLRAHEPHDWYASADQRGSGQGMWLMQKLMRQGPVLSVDSTPPALAVVDKLGFQGVDDARKMVLPLSARLVVDQILQRKPAVPRLLARGPAEVVTKAWFRRFARRAPAGLRAVPVGGIGPEIVDLYAGGGGYGLVKEPDPAFVSWTGRWPGAGQQLLLYAVEKGRVVGWVWGAVKRDGDRLRGRIQELFWPGAGPERLRWLLAEMVGRMIPFGVTDVVGWTTSAALQRAFSACRFIDGGAVPVRWWTGKKTLPLPSGPFHIGAMTLDATVLPLPPKWPPV